MLTRRHRRGIRPNKPTKEEAIAAGWRMVLGAINDSMIILVAALHDEFGFGTHRIAKFMKKRDTVIQAINRKEITVDQALEVLNKEDGLSIRTDFDPEVPEIKEVDKSEVE